MDSVKYTECFLVCCAQKYQLVFKLFCSPRSLDRNVFFKCRYFSNNASINAYLATKRRYVFILNKNRKFPQLVFRSHEALALPSIFLTKKTAEVFSKSKRKQRLKQCITIATGYNNVTIELLVLGIRWKPCYCRGSYLSRRHSKSC